jgi:hypothetical protein
MLNKKEMMIGIVILTLILSGIANVIVVKALEKTVDFAEGGFLLKEKIYPVTSFNFKKEREYVFLFPYDEEYIFLHLENGSTKIIHPQELDVVKGKNNQLFIQQEIYKRSKKVRDEHYKLVLSDSDYKKFSSQYAFMFNRALP